MSNHVCIYTFNSNWRNEPPPTWVPSALALCFKSMCPDEEMFELMLFAWTFLIISHVINYHTLYLNYNPFLFQLTVENLGVTLDQPLLE